MKAFSALLRRKRFRFSISRHSGSKSRANPPVSYLSIVVQLSIPCVPSKCGVWYR